MNKYITFLKGCDVHDEQSYAIYECRVLEHDDTDALTGYLRCLHVCIYLIFLKFVPKHTIFNIGVATCWMLSVYNIGDPLHQAAKAKTYLIQALVISFLGNSCFLINKARKEWGSGRSMAMVRFKKPVTHSADAEAHVFMKHPAYPYVCHICSTPRTATKKAAKRNEPVRMPSPPNWIMEDDRNWLGSPYKRFS